jgi:hypothetical protein
MAKTIKIPATIEEATTELKGLGALLTAKNWARAAIVYAFTEPDPGAKRAQTSGGNPTEVRSISDFARLGIVGLTVREDVGYYRKAWEIAMDDGADLAAPNGEVEEPTRPWPPHPRGRDQKDVARSTARNHPEKIAELLEEDPKIASALILELLDNAPTFVAMFQGEYRKRHEVVRETTAAPGREINYSHDLVRGTDLLVGVFTAMREERWTPDVMEQTLISFAARLISDIAAGNVSTTNLFDEIALHLHGARS